jgi:hypothetical protein
MSRTWMCRFEVGIVQCSIIERGVILEGQDRDIASVCLDVYITGAVHLCEGPVLMGSRQIYTNHDHLQDLLA